jgi:peptide/nickel transport system substrate-binding protein
VETLEFYTYSTFDALSLALIRGDIDMYYKYASGFPPPYLPRLVQDSSVQLMYGDSMGIPAALGFNLHKHPVANPDIRKALALAINYEKISQSLLGNTGKIPSAGFVPPAVPFHLGQAPLVFSPEQSRKTFSTAGFVDTDNDGRINSPEGINLSLKLLARSDLEGTDAILQILTHNFKQVGVDLTIDRVDLSTWITRLNEDRHDLVLFRTTPWGMVMDAGCGSGYFDSRRNGGATLANIEDPIFHALCDRVLENTNPETEQALYHEIQRYYAKHLPAVALSWAVNAYPLSNRLQNPVVNPIEGGLANREAFSQLLFSSDY